MNRLRFVFFLGCAAALGCGGQTGKDSANAGGGSGAGATGGSGATGGTGGSGAIGGTGGQTGGSGGTPAECSVPVTEPGPYPTTIRLVNPSDLELWVTQDCEMEWTLLACVDDYQNPIPTSASCSIECSAVSSGCVMCEPCMVSQQLVPPGGSLDIPWSGYTYSFGQTSDGCQCHHESYAPPAKYAARVSVYSNIAEAEAGESGWDATAYFELPTKTGIVELSLVGVK